MTRKCKLGKGIREMRGVVPCHGGGVIDIRGELVSTRTGIN